MKTCTACGKGRAEGAEFGKCSNRADGLMARCKTCQNAWQREKDRPRLAARRASERRRRAEIMARNKALETVPVPPHKRCAKCGRTAAEGAVFWRDSACGDGLRARCANCCLVANDPQKRLDNRKYYEAHREKALQSSHQVSAANREANLRLIAEHGFLPPPPASKKCSRCGRSAGDGAVFSRSLPDKLGWSSWCRACGNQAKKARYHSDIEASREMNRQWTAKNRDKIRVWSKGQRQRTAQKNAEILARLGEMPIPPDKRCPRCLRTSTMGATWYRNPSTADGLSNRCKDCFMKDRRARAVLVPIPSEDKRCIRCGRGEQDGARWCRNRYRPDGLAAYCHWCRGVTGGRRPSRGRRPIDRARRNWKNRTRYWSDHDASLRKERLRPPRNTEPWPSVLSLDAPPRSTSGKPGSGMIERTADMTAVDPEEAVIGQLERAAALSWMAQLSEADRDLLETFADQAFDIEATATFLGIAPQEARSRLEALQSRARSEITVHDETGTHA